MYLLCGSWKLPGRFRMVSSCDIIQRNTTCLIQPHLFFLRHYKYGLIELATLFATLEELIRQTSRLRQAVPPRTLEPWSLVLTTDIYYSIVS